jgi:hypothetical protein
MDYTKTNWVDELLAGDERYNILDNGGTPISSNVQIALATDVMQAGTAANAAAMNNIESGIETLYGALGSSPQGSYATVMARLAALDTLLGSNPQSIYADLAARLSGYDSGWINLPTCTYASTNSYTLDGDWTTKLKLGVYWSGYNGSQKYGYVLSSSYNSGTGKTTVNLVPNTSYSLANAAITGSKFTYSPTPDFPGWLNFDPAPAASGSMTFALTSLTEARFFIIGRSLRFLLRMTGTTGGTADNAVTFNFPVARDNGNGLVFSAGYLDGGSSLLGGLGYSGATTIGQIRKADASNWGLGAGRIANAAGEIAI